MNDQRKREARIQSGIAFLLGLSVLVLLALLLQKELTPHQVSSEGRSPVAKLQFGMNLVQRKFNREVLWNGIARDETLYLKDAIRTAEESEATIRFNDGLILELEENSLVILDRSDEKVSIEFLKGSVFARASAKGGEVEIQTESGKVKVGQETDGALSLRKGNDGLELTVSQGSATLKGQTGSTQLNVNEVGRLGRNGVTKKKIRILSIHPPAKKREVIQQEMSKVTFSWVNRSKNPDTFLQVAKDGEFKELVYDRASQKESKVSLREGSYYWRVITLKKGKIEDTSETRALKIIKHEKVILVSPESEKTYEYYEERPVIRLQWRDRSNSKNTYVEFSKSKNFTSKLKPSRIQLDKGSVSESYFNELPPGNYFWRVVSRYDDKKITTESRKLQVKQMDRLPSPIIVSPQPEASFSLEENKKTVRLVWNPVSEARGYRVKVASDPEFQDIIFKGKVSNSEIQAELSKVGKFFWSVQAYADTDRSKENSKFSIPSPFYLARSGGFKLVEPRYGQSWNYYKKLPELKFKWESYSGAKGFQVEFASDQGFSSILKTYYFEDVRSFSSKDIPQGKRYWRVKAIGKNGSVVALSEVGHYQVVEVPVLGAPLKIVPRPQSVFDAAQRPEIEFKWKEVGEVRGYFLEVKKQGKDGKIRSFFKKKIEGNSFSKKLSTGIYRWDVRAIDRAGRKGSSGQERQVEVRYKDRFAAPSIQYPKRGRRFEGDVPKHVLLKWEPIRGALGYLITLEKINRAGTTETVKKQATIKSSLRLPLSLAQGDYRWSVAALGNPAKSDSKKRSRTLASLKEEVPGEEAVSDFSIEWNGVLAAPSFTTIKVEGEKK